MSDGDMQRQVDDQAELRKAWVAQQRAWRAAYARLEAAGVPANEMGPLLPIVDNEGMFTGLLCGARSRQHGRPCRQRSLYASGRCLWHGGASVGPQTAAGKAKVTANLPWAQRLRAAAGAAVAASTSGGD